MTVIDILTHFVHTAQSFADLINAVDTSLYEINARKPPSPSGSAEWKGTFDDSASARFGKRMDDDGSGPYAHMVYTCGARDGRVHRVCGACEREENEKDRDPCARYGRPV